MSSPASNPNPYYRSRSIFGPLVLITLGVLFLLRNTGLIPYRSMAIWFAHYWPLLLILWGVVRLFEYIWAKQHGQPAPRLGGGAIVLLIFIILIGSASTGMSRLPWDNIRTEMDIDPDSDFSDPFGFFGLGNRYEFTQNLSQSLKSGSMVRILARHSDITVTTSPDDQAHFFIRKVVRSESQDKANQVNDATHAQIEQQGDAWVLNMTSGDYRTVSLHLDLQLPRNYGVSLATRSGSLSVAQRDGNVDLQTDHGDVNVEQIKGNASVKLRGGSVTVREISGDVTLDGNTNDSNVSDVRGRLTMNGNYRGVQLSKIGNRGHFSSTRTNLDFGRLDGDLSMDLGSLRATAITGPFAVDTRSKNIVLNSVSGEIHIDNPNGDIEVLTKAPLGPIDITGRHGAIKLSLPANSGFQLDAESDLGSIMTDFGVKVDEGRNSIARATVGKGGPSVHLKTQSGTIQVRKD
jgi:DUF4097 and DUF4098 domain-containing protein YvlB